MKTYEKPLVMVNNDLAEGVYAASGGTSVTVPTLRITSDNGFGYGQAVFDYNFGADWQIKSDAAVGAAFNHYIDGDDSGNSKVQISLNAFLTF